jgi:hypothetical protein
MKTYEPDRHRSISGESTHDDGVAMVLVMAWSMMLLGLALVVATAVVRQITPSDHTERSYAALAAAEAGIDDYRAHLYEVPNYYGTTPTQAENPALYDWTPVPGGNTDSEYRYAVDRTSAQAGGKIRIVSMGRSPQGSTGVVRTVEAVLSKRSTLDYVYMSERETPAPTLPGAYSTAANSGVASGTGPTAQALASDICDRRWYVGGRVDATATSTYKQRNLNFCQWAGIYSSETLRGNVHTNDVWRFDTSASLSSSVGVDGIITSSCRTEQDGRTTSETGCLPTRRYIDTNGTASQGSTLNSNNGSGAIWEPPIDNHPSVTSYQGNTWAAYQGTSDPTNRNPQYATELLLPASPDTLRGHASETGCVYTGPTRIRFAVDSGVPVMYVTSPDTKVTRAGCDGFGNDGTKLKSPANAQVTRIVHLEDFTDLVIYVQHAGPATDADEGDNAFDTINRWDAGTVPTCLSKFTGNVAPYYPYVIPNDSVDQSYFSGSGVKGFPSVNADPGSPWYGGTTDSCAHGDLYVQGTFQGQVMLATEHNIILTSSLKDSTANLTADLTSGQYGQPLQTSLNQSIMGLASKAFTYIYRPTMVESLDSGGHSYSPKRYPWATDWKVANARDPVFNFALLAITQCFATQDPYYATRPQDPTYGDRNGNIYFWGSLAQKYRCVVGSTGGYNKKYSYDGRIGDVVPPYMMELSGEPWRGQQRFEISPQPQGLVLKSYNLAYPDDGTGAQVTKATLAWPPVSDGNRPTMTGPTGTSITITPRHAGPIIVNYDIKHTVASTVVTENRRLVIYAQ